MIEIERMRMVAMGIVIVRMSFHSVSRIGGFGGSGVEISSIVGFSKKSLLFWGKATFDCPEVTVLTSHSVLTLEGNAEKFLVSLCSESQKNSKVSGCFELMIVVDCPLSSQWAR